MTRYDFNYTYTGDIQHFTAPYGGKYKLECHGAQGGITSYGGRGGCSSGAIKLNKGDALYIYVGGRTGWNGGGSGHGMADESGGGATDIRLGGTSLSNRIIVAGGGGGASAIHSTGYTAGGHGGGTIGENGSRRCGYGGTGGTQFNGGPGGSNNGSSGTLGQGGSNCVGSNSGGGGGGGGYYGGGAGGNDFPGFKDMDDSGGGGGSGYIGGVSEGIMNTGTNIGDGFATITLLYDEYAFFFKKDDKYYLPVAKYFNTTTKTFTPVSLNDIKYEIDNCVCNTQLSNIYIPLTIEGQTYLPLDYLDISKSKMCIIPNNSNINKKLNKIELDYNVTPLALSKTVIKIKKPFTEFNTLNNAYFDISATDKSNISYKLDYFFKEPVSSTCNLLDIEILKDTCYASFKLNNITSLLKSVSIYSIDNINYTKIKSCYVDVDISFDTNANHTSITLKKAYPKILINIINRQTFKYIDDTVSTF